MADPKNALLLEIGATGLKRYGGYIQDEFHKDLRGPKAARVYREMQDNHPIIGAAFNVIDLLIRQCPKRIEASTKGDSVQAERARELIETAFDDVDGKLDGVVNSGLQCKGFGWAALEKVFKLRRGDSLEPELRSKYNDGAFGWRKIEIRAQESLDRWDFSEAGELRGFWQRAAPDYRMRYIPRAKFMHFRIASAKNSPEGRSMLRNAYLPYYHESNLKFTEAVGYDRNLAGFPDMQLPPEVMHADASSENARIREMYEDFVKRIRVDAMAGIVRASELDRNNMPTGFKFQLLASSGKSNTEIDVPIRRSRSEIAMVLLSESLLLGEKGGSLALSKDKTDILTLATGALLDNSLDTINEDAIPELVKLNGMPGEVAPKVARGEIDRQSLAELGAYLSAIASQGLIVNDNKLEEHLRDVAGLPAPDAPAPTAPAPTQGAPEVQ